MPDSHGENRNFPDMWPGTMMNLPIRVEVALGIYTLMPVKVMERFAESLLNIPLLLLLQLM